MVTIFGYSAPKSDVEAITMLKKAWGAVKDRNLEEIEIVDLRDENEVIQSWDDFTIGRCSRRSCEATFDRLMMNLWDDHGIKPVIDIRNMWKDGEETRLLGDYKNVVHNFKGNVYCHCPISGKQREMANGGFEKDRGTLKKLIDKLTCVLIIDEENKKGTKKLLLDPYV